ncbi:MAG TPA: metalloregulator ArsR/SmtB family transcription factor [Candidatus Sulfotelmatobacter sp.]|jgi:DNA-binding transcriptional ArsR family regulator|nr:metalloregulator ArsR/SmtB family transcription factor [Candidatus Sulfotelmatobacter sp.]
MVSDHLTATFAALADPTRRTILARLASGESSVTELAEPFEMSLPAVSKHLKVLERAGLISRSRDAQWRPCQLKAKPLRDVADWVEHYRKFWEESFDRLDEYLLELKKKEKKHGRKN